MKKPASRMGVGASSVLLIMVVLSLTAFGVLTLVSARVDARLTERTRESALSYYAAESAAGELIFEVDKALYRGEDPLKIEGVTRAGNTFLIEVPLGDGRVLSAELELQGPSSGARYKLTKYCVENAADWDTTGGEG